MTIKDIIDAVERETTNMSAFEALEHLNRLLDQWREEMYEELSGTRRLEVEELERLFMLSGWQR